MVQEKEHKGRRDDGDWGGERGKSSSVNFAHLKL